MANDASTPDALYDAWRSSNVRITGKDCFYFGTWREMLSDEAASSVSEIAERWGVKLVRDDGGVGYWFEGPCHGWSADQQTSRSVIAAVLDETGINFKVP